ncbi:MAG TPA: class II glutamine amidotransferase [archaeon]|nr:class II glutamine amidotransferase [archaeon]
MVVCRLFATVTSPAQPPEEDLLYFRHLSTVHSDGWGIGWFGRDGPIIQKSPRQALYDSSYLRVARQAVSPVVVAHLRKMTKGNIREVNAHPFHFRDYIFAHNGSISRALKYQLRGGYDRLEGDTDSEALMHFIIQHIDDHKRPLFGIRTAFRKLDRQVASGELRASTLNFLLTDGAKLFAFKMKYGKDNRLFYRHHDNGFSTLQVSSSPLKTRDWVEMEDGELLIADVETADFRMFRVWT